MMMNYVQSPELSHPNDNTQYLGCTQFSKSYKFKKLPIWDFELDQMISKKSNNSMWGVG